MSNKKQAPTPRPTPASVWLSAVAMVMSHQASWGQTPAELVNCVGMLGHIQLSPAQLRQRDAEIAKKAEQAASDKYESQIKSLQAQVNQLQQAAQPPKPVTAPVPAPTPAQSPVPQPPPPPPAIADFTKLASVEGGPEFIVLPLGEFEMGATDGDPDERPIHRVKVRQRIAMGEKEITTAQYMACVNAGGCRQPLWNEAGNNYHFKTGSDKLYADFVGQKQPIVGVSWENAVEYARWLSAQTGHNYRLATEAEWEYGCRAGQKHKYCGGDDVNAVAWYSGNSKRKTQEVGTVNNKNAWNLFDMSGNVWEWVADCYENSSEYDLRKRREPWLADEKSEEKAGCSRVLRGGSWGNVPSNVRSANRGFNSPDIRFSSYGFRLVRTLP